MINNILSHYDRHLNPQIENVFRLAWEMIVFTLAVTSPLWFLIGLLVTR